MAERATAVSLVARLRQALLVATGVLLLLLGLVILPLPAPFGLPLILVGGLLLLANSAQARRLLIQRKRAAPALLAPLVARLERWRAERRRRRQR